LMPLFAVYLVAVVALQGFMLYKSRVWDNGIILAFSFIVPCVCAAVIAIGAGYYQLHTEWRMNTIYLLLSLPVRGWRVLSAKLAAAMSLLIATIFAISISFAVILVRVKWQEWRASDELPPFMPTVLNVAVHSLWMYALAVLFLLVLMQFAFLCGQLVTRMKGLVAVAAFVGMLWLALRISPPLAGLLAWMPDIYFGGQDTDVAYLHSGPFLALIVLSAAMTWVNGCIYEKAVEV